MARHNELGAKGEDVATNYLIKQGYSILERNFRFDKSEIDIICEKGKDLIFVEVKLRSSSKFGYPEEEVNERKMKLLSKAAEQYIEEKNSDKSIRFDIIAILGDGTDYFKIHHIKDCFFPTED